MTDEKQTEAGAGRSRNGSRKRHVRIVFLIAAVLLTAVAAGCSRKPPEEPVKPTAVPAVEVPPELTGTPEATPTPEVTSTPETTPMPEVALTPEAPPATEPAKVPSDTGTAFIPSGTGGRVTFTGMTVDVSAAQVGDTVRFGSYEQDNDTGNGAEAIEWYVLDKQDGKLLLLSRFALDCKRYHEEHEDVTWETCTLRDWLNGTFFTTAFGAAEQGRIVTTRVKNEDNLKWETGGGNDTEDKVFLLSIGETERYFSSDSGVEDPARRVKLTAYAKAQGGHSYCDAEHDSFYTPEYDGNGWWWLRSPGSDGLCAAGVGETGTVWRGSNYILCDNHVVRPALWLNVEE